MKPRILWLHRRKARDPRLAGGKAANLAWVASLGCPVPRGFVVPAGARLDEDPRWSSAIRAAYARLRAPVAVRSSLAGEDGTVRSFAGQLDSVLDVSGPEPLLAAIARVQSSAERPAVRAYADRVTRRSPMDAATAGRDQGDSDEDWRLAILIQEMVPARAAGIAFSADPVTGRSVAVIEAVPQLGDDLAGGRVEPDRFAVDPRGVLVQEDRLSLDEDQLPRRALLRVARLARRAADHFGTPQDMEWAWDGERVYVLQSRPITSLAEKPVFSRKLVGDMAPGPIKLLVWSTNILGMVRGAFGEAFTALTGRTDQEYGKILERIRCHAYVNTTFVGELLADAGFPRNFFDSVAREERTSRRIRRGHVLMTRISRVPAMTRWYWRHRRELRDVLHRHNRHLDSFRPEVWSDLEPAALLERADELLRLHRALQRCVMFGNMNLAIRRRLLARTLARHAPDLHVDLLFVGLKGLKSLEPNRQLQAIADRVGPVDEELAALMLSGSDADIRRALQNGGPVILVEEVDAFLERFGFLGTDGSNFGEPGWAEDPRPVWMALGRLFQGGPRLQDDPAAAREAARNAVRARLAPWRRLRFGRRVASVARYLQLREGMSLLMTEDAHQLRRIFLALGGHLAERGLLEEPEDVFHLTHDELGQLVGGDGAPAREVIRARRDELEASRDADLYETLVGGDLPTVAPDPRRGSVLTGIPASAGVVQGTARVVRSLGDAPLHLTVDDILVVPFSDVGWTPLFTTVGGIVAECGGQLSHTAIVAREYGLPSVVSVRGAVRAIRDGQPITVDGTTGRVYLDGLPAPGVGS